MKESEKSILLVDDEANMLHVLRVFLSKQGYRVHTATDGQAALALLATHDFQFVLSDVRMPEMDGLALLEAMRRRDYRATVIMMSAYGAIDLALETMKQGAYDYISKPFKLDEIVLVLRKAEERERLRRENQRLKERLVILDGPQDFEGMIGRSQAMQQVFALAEKVARFEATVLISGESGTGKELIARGIHRLGKGEEAPFIAVNCGGIPAHLLESEFFGHVRGAFTGADRDKKGLIEEAEGGTLFLDEVGEMPLEVQVKLLRVLQDQEVRRVGAVKSRPVRTRILAATNRNLDDMVRRGLFRQDLFYRLKVFTIHIPPLREHREDIVPLSQFFLSQLTQRMDKRIDGIAPPAMQQLMRHDWPGNVRELRSALERAVILAEAVVLLPEHLPEACSASAATTRVEDLFDGYSLKKARHIMERTLILRAMEASGGNKTKAAELLELSYPALLAKLKEYDTQSQAFP